MGVVELFSWVVLTFDSAIYGTRRKLNANMLSGTLPLEVLSLVIAGNLTELWVICQFQYIVVSSTWLHYTTRWYSLFSADTRKKMYSFRNIAKNDLASTVRSSGLRGIIYMQTAALIDLPFILFCICLYNIWWGLQELHLYWHYHSDCNHPGQAENYMMMSPWIRTSAFFMRMLAINK